VIFSFEINSIKSSESPTGDLAPLKGTAVGGGGFGGSVAVWISENEIDEEMSKKTKRETKTVQVVMPRTLH
jgi:hypothetical protein